MIHCKTGSKEEQHLASTPFESYLLAYLASIPDIGIWMIKFIDNDNQSWEMRLEQAPAIKKPIAVDAFVAASQFSEWTTSSLWGGA